MGLGLAFRLGLRLGLGLGLGLGLAAMTRAPPPGTRCASVRCAAAPRYPRRGRPG